MPSTACEISRAERRRVPLNSRCSMKWEMPLTASASHRPPTPTQIPRLTLAMCGISAVATVNPFSSRVTWYIGKMKSRGQAGAQPTVFSAVSGGPTRRM